ncbi:MAG: zinc transporter ZupT [Myxococcota bacterium]|nr:zinc transporter ZupT [Myxococcota bacterium]
MIEFSNSDLIRAFLVTTAAGLATVIGGLLVLFSKRSNARILAFGLAFASGAMVYVSLTEIFTKSVDSFSVAYGNQDLGFMYGSGAFLLGIVCVAILDMILPNPHGGLVAQSGDENGEPAVNLKRVGLLTMVAITAHNFPEGLATFFTMLDNSDLGLSLAVAITLHNIPEGVSIAIPVYYATNRASLAIGACFLSGLAEPVGAALGFAFLGQHLSPAVFGGVFGFIAGIMVFLSMDELLPAAKQYSRGHETVYGLVLGMASMSASLVAFRL